MDDLHASNFIIEQFKKVQSSKVMNSERTHAVHVSNLTGTCMRKPWYEFHQPELPVDYKSICNFFLGTLLHENVELGGRNEISVSANIRTMTPINAEEINNQNFYDCITGTIDDLVDVDGETIIVDKKTANRIPEQPASGYVMQINIYKLLLFINEKIEIKHGAILYLDKPSSFFESKCFVFDLMSLDEIKKMVTEKLDQLKMDSEPRRIVTDKCNWCQFLKICDPYNNGGFGN